MHKKILTVVGITILFLGTCITPIVANDYTINIETKGENNDDLPLYC